jgi:uncharacterized OsmC-like protein
MSDIIYVSRSHIERRVGPIRIARLPGEPQDVVFSLHGALAEYYKVAPIKLIGAHSSTIDYVVAATAACMLNTFGGALEKRQINASNRRLVGEATGEVIDEGGVLVLRSIHVVMRLDAPESTRPVVARVHGLYAMDSPLYRTFHKAIEISSSYEITGK